MKYILTNDIKFFFKKKKLFIISYIFIILLFILTIRTFNFNTNNDALCKVIGISYDLQDNYIYVFVYALNICMSIYLCILLFTRDIKIGKENIFLRMKNSNWFMMKIISIFLTTILLKALIYVMAFIFLNNGLIDYKVIFLDLMNILCFQIISIIIYYIGIRNKKIVALIFLILIIVFYKIGKFSLLSIKYCNLVIVIVYILLFMIATILFKKDYILIFEKEEN